MAVEVVLIAWDDAEVDEDDRVERAARSELKASGDSDGAARDADADVARAVPDVRG